MHNVMSVLIFFFVFSSLLTVLFSRSLTLFIITVYLLFCFFSGWNLFSFFFLWDFISWSMVMLTAFITALMIMSTSMDYSVNEKNMIYIFSFLLLMILLFFCFGMTCFFFFFIFFEFSILPIFFLIVGWGNNFERMSAGLYMFIYTLLFSLPFFFSILAMDKFMGLFDFFHLKYSYNFNFNFFLKIFLTLVFMVKFPIYFFHMWLPKAHVEAPLSGSMVLAGVLLKLGGYGLLRLLPIMFDFNLMKNFFLSFGISGGLISSFICFRQTDLKCMVAYMSVAHMGLVITCLFTVQWVSMIGVIFMMLAHGLSSSGLFCFLGVIYDRLKSRSLMLLKGSYSYFGIASFWGFMLLVCNMSCPPSFNFFSEVLLVWSLMKYNFFFSMFFSIYMFFGCVYSIYFFTSLFHGNSIIFFSLKSYSIRESFLFFVHTFPLFFFFSFF